jgi:hypothetical protein
MIRETYIKGNCDDCAEKRHCPRMHGEAVCYGKKEKIIIRDYKIFKAENTAVEKLSSRSS